MALMKMWLSMSSWLLSLGCCENKPPDVQTTCGCTCEFWAFCCYFREKVWKSVTGCERAFQWGRYETREGVVVEMCLEAQFGAL